MVGLNDALNPYLSDLRILVHDLVPDGKWVLVLRGQMVAVVNRGDPIEDAECDTLLMPRSDFNAIMAENTK